MPQINSESSALNIGITDMPSQHTLTLLDWYREGMKPADLDSATYHSGLINGRGRLNTSTVTPLSVFNVVSGIIYRFRVIGAQNHFAYRLSIQNHDLHVIATDGNEMVHLSHLRLWTTWLYTVEKDTILSLQDEHLKIQSFRLLLKR